MKKISFIAILASIVIGCKTESIRLDEVRDAIPLEETKNILFTLASDDMKGRDSKSGGYTKAASFVEDYLQKHNIQPFYPAYRDSLMTDSLWSYNVVGSIGKYDPNKKTILIGAHLDHIGIKEQEGDSIYNGANDNATGSTAVLQIARFLSQKKWKQNVVVALFADEEKGLKGAYHLAERMKKEQVDLAYMVNFEMLGITLTTGENQVYMTGYNLSDMANKMNAISPNFVQFLPQAKEYNLFRRSDNYAFYEAFGVPAQTLSTFDFKNYDHYHKAGDEAEKMEVENMNTVIGTAAYTIAKLLDEEVNIEMNEKVE
jgi:bacterial leucyl aminopeptidase